MNKRQSALVLTLHMGSSCHFLHVALKKTSRRPHGHLRQGLRPHRLDPPLQDGRPRTSCVPRDLLRRGPQGQRSPTGPVGEWGPPGALVGQSHRNRGGGKLLLGRRWRGVTARKPPSPPQPAKNKAGAVSQPSVQSPGGQAFCASGPPVPSALDADQEAIFSSPTQWRPKAPICTICLFLSSVSVGNKRQSGRGRGCADGGAASPVPIPSGAAQG